MNILDKFDTELSLAPIKVTAAIFDVQIDENQILLVFALELAKMRGFLSNSYQTCISWHAKNIHGRLEWS